MKRKIERFISTYFIIFALLYLTQRYSSFDMHPLIIIIIGAVLLFITVTVLMQKLLKPNIFTVSVIVFTLFIMLTSLL